MPRTKTAKSDSTAAEADQPQARRPKTDVQGHRVDDPDYIPARDDYDPAKHANHSHFDPE